MPSYQVSDMHTLSSAAVMQLQMLAYSSNSAVRSWQPVCRDWH